MAIVYGSVNKTSQFQTYFAYSITKTNTTWKVIVSEAGVKNTNTVKLSGEWDLSAYNTVNSAKYSVGYKKLSIESGAKVNLLSHAVEFNFARIETNRSITLSIKSSGRNIFADGDSSASIATYTFTLPQLSSYEITYDANGGTNAPKAQKKFYDSAIFLQSSTPTRTGYQFLNWNTKQDGSGTTYNPGEKYTVNASLALYAKWKINTYTISYNANGGKNAPSNGTKTYNISYTISKDKPVRTGYSFVNWNTKLDGTGVSYNSGDAYTKNVGLTLYATWKKVTYTVTYDANGGTGAPSKQTKQYNVDLILSNVRPTRAGWTFVGWGKTSSDTVVSYNPQSVYTANGSIILYAIWKKTLTLSYNANGGTGKPSNQSKTIYNTTKSASFSIPKVIPTRQNYAFKGWYVSSNSSKLYSVNTSITISQNTTLYAKWNISYAPPSLGRDLVIARSNGNILDDEGTYGYVYFTWTDAIYNELPKKATVIVQYKQPGTIDTWYTIQNSSTKSNEFESTFGAGNLDESLDYEVRIILRTDGFEDLTYKGYVTRAQYVFDVNAAGTSVAFFGVAPEYTPGFYIYGINIFDLISHDGGMTYKGTIGVGGTLPNVPTTYKAGDTYNIITAGRYAGYDCLVGDFLVASGDSGTASAGWSLIPMYGTAVAEAEEMAQAAYDYADEARTYAHDAFDSAERAETLAGQAAVAAENAEASASQAATAATNAEADASRAATAATNAETDAGRAATAAETAEGLVDEAAQSASLAATQASNAATSASNAEASASQAEASASQAATAATNAQTSAGIASDNALASAHSASEAETSASQAAASAATAQADAHDASVAAQGAQASAVRANTAANSALTQLAIVEDVAGTLDWISKHGTYEQTQDITVQNGTVYFSYDSSSGDYVPIVSPDASANPQQEGWFILNISEAQGDFIMSHLAVTSRGLWVLPNGAGTGTTPAQGESQADSDARQGANYKVLLSNQGMQIYDGSGNLVSNFGESITFSSDRPQYIGGENSYIIFYDSNNDGLPDAIDIGGSSVTIGGTKRLSDVLTNVDISTQQTSGGATITVGGHTAYLYDGVSPIDVKITSDKGDKIIKGNETLTLTCTVFQGTTDITSQVQTFNWYKMRSNGTEHDPTFSRNNASSITVNASEIDFKAVIGCQVTLQ